ncbi:MAG: P-II family nitrogen regulator [Kiloniellales bacterium]|nr:P-II family nitrogen regulator [Kiloniellales bacterium]
MSDNEITYLTDVALLTVVFQAGRAEAILKAAREIGATTGAIGYRVNGFGARELLGVLGVAVEVEREVISILVATDQADAVMDHLYRGGGLDTPGAGYIYVTPLDKAAAYIPKSMRERLDAN